MTTTNEQTATPGRVAEPVTLEKARELLKRVTDERGRDFIYNAGGRGSCRYRPLVDGDETGLAEDDPRRSTGCMVGEALKLAGEARHLEHGGSVRSLAEIHQDMLTPQAVDYFQAAQFLQDDGRTWGFAYDEAERRLAMRAEASE